MIKIFALKNPHLKEKIYVEYYHIFLNSSSAKLAELNVVVVTKNSIFSFLFISSIIGRMLLNSPMLAA